MKLTERVAFDAGLADRQFAQVAEVFDRAQAGIVKTRPVEEMIAEREFLE